MAGTVVCYGRGDVPPAGFVLINCTSRSADWGRVFSPFLLGPCEIAPQGRPKTAKCMESAWQYSKVYADQLEAGDARGTGRITPAWEAWSDAGFASALAVRYPRGRGAKPLFSLCQGRRLTYVEARAELYAPLYAAAVRRHAAAEYARLIALVRGGSKVALFDFDGYDETLAALPAARDLRGVLHNEHRKMGHSFVLRGMVEADLAAAPPFWTAPVVASNIHRTPVPRRH